MAVLGMLLLAGHAGNAGRADNPLLTLRHFAANLEAGRITRITFFYMSEDIMTRIAVTPSALEENALWRATRVTPRLVHEFEHSIPGTVVRRDLEDYGDYRIGLVAQASNGKRLFSLYFPRGDHGLLNRRRVLMTGPFTNYVKSKCRALKHLNPNSVFPDKAWHG